MLPHKGVYTRLGRSAIHGIGVIAIRDIPKGTNVFEGDNSKIVWINKSEFLNIEPEIRKLYDDFCVIKSDKYGCPENFNSLTVGWYLNESKDNPNVCCTENYEFITTRDIKKGEELLANYSEYSDDPDKVGQFQGHNT